MKQKPTGDLQYVQQMNRRLVLETVLNHGPLSKIEISRMTTLSPTTVGNAIVELQMENLVGEIGKVVSPLGRRPTLLDIRWDSRTVVGLAVVDNQVVGVRTNIRANVQKTCIQEFETNSDIISILKHVVNELMQGQDATRVLGIGLATPGILNRKNGEIENIANFPWKNLNFAREIVQDTSVPWVIENDTNAAAIGEAYFGRGRGVDSFCYVHVGTGVGAGLIVDRHILLGSRGYAGEVGHMTVDWKGKLCQCGSVGCLEAYVSWRAISTLLQENLSDEERGTGDFTTISDRSGYLQSVYSQGNVSSALSEVAEILAAGLASLVSTMDPRMVIVDGIFHKCDEFMATLQRKTKQRLINFTNDQPTITTGELGEFASVAGMIALILEKNGFIRSPESLVSAPYQFVATQLSQPMSVD